MVAPSRLLSESTSLANLVRVQATGGETRALGAWFAQLEDAPIAVADYTALKALTAGRYLSALVMDDNRGGVFDWLSGSQTALVSSDPYEGLYVPPASDTTGASGVWVRQTTADYGYANWWGAVGDWNNGAQTGTDNAPFINACWDFFDSCRIRKGSYAVGSVLTLDVIGSELLGEGQDDTSLFFTSTTGHCVQVLQRYCEVRGISILASTARTASAYAATKCGLVIGGDGAGSLIANHVEDVTVFYQPGDGIVCQGGVNNTIFRHVVAAYNNGHGWFVDNGTRAGITTGQPGIDVLENCQATENGGCGLWLMPTSSVNCYRWLLRQFECYDNGWNDPLYATGGALTSGITGGAQIYVGGESHELIDCAFGDERYASTTTIVGTTRLAKSAASGSINFALGKNFAAVNTRHIATAYMMTTGNNLEGIYTRGAYASNAMTTAYVIGSGCTGVDLDLSDVTNVTNPVDSLSPGIITVGGVRGLLASHGIAAYFRQDTAQTTTITSGAISATADLVVLTGEGGVADDLTDIVNAGGGNYLPAGAKVSLLNLNAYDITVKNATGNIYTKTAADVALGTNEGITFRQYGNNLYEV